MLKTKQVVYEANVDNLVKDSFIYQHITVMDNEFETYSVPSFEKLILYKGYGLIKQKILLAFDILNVLSLNQPINVYFFGISNGGCFIYEFIKKVNLKSLNVKYHIISDNMKQNANFRKNNSYFKIDLSSIIYLTVYDYKNLKQSNNTLDFYIFDNTFTDFKGFPYNNNGVVFTKNDLQLENKKKYRVSFDNSNLYISNNLVDRFMFDFKYYISEGSNLINYKNLLHYTMIVKNAGDILKEVLAKNFDKIDQWTIMDTGSTDNTIEIINSMLHGKKRGRLYSEPFVNFKYNRNLCLDLAEKDNFCLYTVQLDDTYVIEGDIESFLNITKDDGFAQSFTFYIQSYDSQYITNRILKFNKKLKYRYRIHEVIEKNVNVLIPPDKCTIKDLNSDYMQNRTNERKKLDLKFLFEEIEENPNDPRSYYYIGQTYSIMKEYELAYKYFIIRASIVSDEENFLQEKIDAIFEAARIANFHIHKPREVYELLYTWAYSLDETRPDSLYFLGINYYLDGPDKDLIKAFNYFKKGFKIGYPIHAQYSLKPTLSYYFLPYYLTELCFRFNDFTLGLEVSNYFLNNNPENSNGYGIVKNYNTVFDILIKNKPISPPIEFKEDQKTFIFVIDGGFSPWIGSDIEKNGVGGSETWAIETATYVAKNSNYNVLFFCNTPNKSTEVYKDVTYKHLSELASFINTYEIEHCIISRFDIYVPITLKSNVKNIYFILHDIAIGQSMLIDDPKLKNIICLSEWHKSQFLQLYPIFESITVVNNYGIDVTKFIHTTKIKNSFIYSSYPNRGLIYILQMWPKIKEKVPDASLHIYSDVNNKWSNSVFPDMMQTIRDLLEKLTDLDINYYGWVNKYELYEGWCNCEYWLYPCIFAETFCLTAFEAAASKTCAITNDLAALQNTVADRGVIIKGSALNMNEQKNIDEWIQRFIDSTISIINNPTKKNELINTNYDYVLTRNWENSTIELMKKLSIEHIDNEKKS